jgi:hypothetical protein
MNQKKVKMLFKCVYTASSSTTVPFEPSPSSGRDNRTSHI